MTTKKTYGGTSGPEAKYTTLVSSDGHEFIIKKKIAVCAKTLNAMLSSSFQEGLRNELPFPTISAIALQKVCHYLTYAKVYSGSENEIPDFEVQPRVAGELLLAAHYLDL